MDNSSSKDRSGSDSPHWPTGPILTYGTFGTRDVAGRRYHFRSSIALAAMALSMLVPKHGLDWIFAFAPGAAFIYIAWEFRKYLSAQDELARRILLESIAWTYLCGLAAAMLLGGLGMVYGWRVNPMWFIALEPVRAGWLYFVARRYQ